LDSTHATTTRPALALERVTVAFDPDHRVLEQVDLEVADGEFVALVGPSGCGKSTVLRLMAGLLEPGSGLVDRSGDQRIALVFQEPNLLPWRTVQENIRLPLELLGVEPGETRQRVNESLELIGFGTADALKRPRELSDLLREQLNEELLAIHSARSTTAVFVTHNVSEAVFLSDRVVVMPPEAGVEFTDIAVDFPRPRTASLRAEAAFARLAGDVSARLRRGGEEVEA